MESPWVPSLPVLPIARLILSRQHWELMRSHVDAGLPFEACGLLAGDGDTVRDVLPIRNQLRSSTRFRMEPAEQLRAFADIGDKGWSLVGIFHSHPAAPGESPLQAPAPSATDIDEASYPVVHVVWSRSTGAWAARGYWIEDGHVSDVALGVEEMK